MIIIKFFTADELGLTYEEERALREQISGCSDCCYDIIEVLSKEDAIDEYSEDRLIDLSVNEKLLNTGLVEPGEYVMINLCW